MEQLFIFFSLVIACLTHLPGGIKTAGANLFATKAYNLIYIVVGHSLADFTRSSEMQNLNNPFRLVEDTNASSLVICNGFEYCPNCRRINSNNLLCYRLDSIGNIMLRRLLQSTSKQSSGRRRRPRVLCRHLRQAAEEAGPSEPSELAIPRRWHALTASRHEDREDDYSIFVDAEQETEYFREQAENLVTGMRT